MADVLADLKNWSATAASNSPSGSTSIGTGLDDNLRQLQATVRQDLASVGANIASASTCDLGAVAGLFHTITGTTTITSFGTVAAGIWKVLTFSGAVTITHNGTSLICPYGANFTTTANDTLLAQSLGSGNWKIHPFHVATLYAALAGSASQVFNVASATANDHAVSRTFGDARYAPIAGSVGSLIGLTTITSTNATWTPNASTTKMIVCVVGGGSGGGATAAFNTGTAEGGHAGQIAWGGSTSVSGTYAATIGAGSAGGAGAGASSSQGGTSSFIGTGLSVSAVGGIPAFGGASVAAPFTSGFNGEACIGVGGLGTYGTTPGAAAANSGAGGGSAKNDSGSSRNGAAGGSGVIFVWEYR